MSTISAEAVQVLYIEAREDGSGQQTAFLHAQLEQLPTFAGFLGAELQSSPAQPGLLLVTSRWAGHAPEGAWPEGVRAWVFEVVRVVGPRSG